VAKGKGRAGSKPFSAAASSAAASSTAAFSVAAPQAESRESTTADPTPALAREFEGQVSSKQLQALRKRVAEQEEYTRLL